MSKKQRQHGAALKAQVGLEAPKAIQPVHVIAAKHQGHSTQVNQWKKEVAERLPEVFTKQADPEALAAKQRERELYAEIGKLKKQLDWLKKIWPVWGLSSAATTRTPPAGQIQARTPLRKLLPPCKLTALRGLPLATRRTLPDEA